jgi:hypothetical protein
MLIENNNSLMGGMESKNFHKPKNTEYGVVALRKSEQCSGFGGRAS